MIRKGMNLLVFGLILFGGWHFLHLPSSNELAGDATVHQVHSPRPLSLVRIAESSQPKSEELEVSSIDTAEKFKKLTEEVFNALPSIERMRNLSPEELHHSPVVLLEAGERLGEIAQILEDHPSYAREAAEFYSRCAKSDQLPPSIRAVCFSDFEKISENVRGSLELSSVPEEVRQLAGQL